MLSKSVLHRPPRYVLASVLCSFGGFLFGMDTGIIGSVVVMKSYTAEFGLLTPTVHGLIVSSILIPAAIASCFSGRVADVLGRTKNIAIGSLVFGIGAAIEASAVHLAMFVIGRIIEGIGEGLYLGTLVVYICEISPPSKRGPLTAGPQLMITAGLVVGFFTCYGSATLESSISWRAPFIVLAGLAFIFAVASALYLAPSPRWLMLRGRDSEVAAAWEILEVGSAEREKAEVELQAVLSNRQNVDPILASTTDPNVPAVSNNDVQQIINKSSILDVFASDVRSRTLLGVFLMGMQQMSGIDGVLYYAPLLFEQAGLTSQSASFLASGVSAIVIFAVTIPALVFSDKWSRRSSTVIGGLILSILMFLIGILYATNSVHARSGAGRWIVIVSIYLFAATFCVSWAIGIKIYAAESQPQRTRASATNLAHGSNWACNFLVALTTPILLARSSFGAYFLFGGCTALTALVCLLWMPETRGKSLDEIEDAFRRKTKVSSGFLRALQRVIGRGTAAVVP